MPPPERTPAVRSWISIALALFVGVFLFAMLFLLTGGAAAAIAGAGIVVFVVAGFHYFVWGWWLSALITRDVAEEEAEDSDPDSR
jgi:hypothetical protein